MANPPFDASKAVTFDLTRGQIQNTGGDGRLLIAARTLLSLCHSLGGEGAHTWGRAIGGDLGGAVAARFERSGLDVRQASLEAVTEHLGGELALAGFGILSIERWGRAMVLVVDHAPLGVEGDDLLSSVLAGAISRATSVEAFSAKLARDGVRARFLIGGQSGVDQVRGWLESGVSWGEALVRLHPATRGAL